MKEIIWILGGLTFALLCGLAGVLIAYLLFGRKRGDSDD